MDVDFIIIEWFCDDAEPFIDNDKLFISIQLQLCSIYCIDEQSPLLFHSNVNFIQTWAHMRWFCGRNQMWHLNAFATGNTLLCDWRLYHANHITISVVTSKHFIILKHSLQNNEMLTRREVTLSGPWTNLCKFSTTNICPERVNANFN